MLFDYETAEDAFTTVVNNAGTVNRDTVERRIVSETVNGTYTYTGPQYNYNGIIDVETDAEGFFDYSTDYTVPTDTDGDGMPDEWEEQYGLDPTAEDQNTLNADGYTALEVYLNSLMGETMNTDFATTGITNLSTTAPQISFDRSTGTLTVSDNAIGGIVRIYTADGRMLCCRTITSSRTTFGSLPGELLLIQVTGGNLRPRIIKCGR